MTKTELKIVHRPMKVDPAEHLELARAVAYRRFKRHTTIYDEDDLVQEANEALVRAARKFDPGRGVAFSSYAYRAIVTALNRFVRCNGRVGRVPVWAIEAKGKAQPDTCRQVAAMHDGASITDVVMRRHGREGEQQARVEAANQSERVREELNTLDPRSRFVLVRRFLEPDRESLSQIGRLVGVGAERARQIQNEALDALRYRLADQRETA